MYSLELEGTIHDEEEKKGMSWRRLKAQMAMAGYRTTKVELAKILGLTTQSLMVRQNNPGRWNRRDIAILIDALNLTPEQVIEIWFCNTSADKIVQQRKKDFEERIKLL